jgi:hypothetical protein
MLIDIEPKFDNTTAKASYNGDDLMAYRIYPNEGYLLHTTSYDEPILDDEGNETGEVKKGYTEGFISLNKNYDFEANPFEVYAIAKGDVE